MSIALKIGQVIRWIVDFLGLFQFIKWLGKALGLGEHIEFIVHYAPYLGRVGTVIEALLDPPPIIGVLFVLAALLFIWWDARRVHSDAPRGSPKLISVLSIVGGVVLIIGGIAAIRFGIGLYSTAPIIVGDQLPQGQKSPEIAPIAPPQESMIRTPPPPIVNVPAPPPPSPPKIPGREFVEAHVTPEFLVGLYDGNTTLRAETLISEQKGKWMPVSGPLGEIHSSGIVGFRTTLVVFASRQKPTIYMWFSEEWIDRLAILPKNKNISVVGQIKKVVGYDPKVELENCELLDSNPTTSAPPQTPNTITRPRHRRSSKSNQRPSRE